VDITEIRVKLMDESEEQRLQAFCSITLDDSFVIRDLKIIEGATGPFVAMPSRKLTAHCPQCGCKNHLRAAYCNQCSNRLKEMAMPKDEEGHAKLYADIAHPINSECREMIQRRVIQAFKEERARSRMPGYVSRYDDFEADETPTPYPPRITGATTRLQKADGPQGPHVASPKRQPTRARSDGFGAGIFD
jgi:stage V sporulation protein G